MLFRSGRVSDLQTEKPPGLARVNEQSCLSELMMNPSIEEQAGMVMPSQKECLQDRAHRHLSLTEFPTSQSLKNLSRRRDCTVSRLLLVTQVILFKGHGSPREQNAKPPEQHLSFRHNNGGSPEPSQIKSMDLGVLGRMQPHLRLKWGSGFAKTQPHHHKPPGKPSKSKKKPFGYLYKPKSPKYVAK